MPPRPPALDAPQEEIDDLDFASVLNEHLCAGYQALYVPTSEEARAEAEIGKVAKRLGMSVITWDVYEGFSDTRLKAEAKFKNPVYALEKLGEENAFSQNNVLIFRDLDDYFPDPNIRRRIKSLVEGNRLVNKTHKWPLIILSPRLQIHEKLKTCISVLDFKLPDEKKLGKVVEFIQHSIEGGKHPERAQCAPELKEDIIRCLQGLTSTEAENCLSRCLVHHGGFQVEMLNTIKDEKAAVVRKSETLEYIREDTIVDIADIGGWDNYIEWLKERKPAYSKDAQRQRIDAPKGVVLMGIPGTGKSMVGFATCNILNLPGYVLDVGSVFGSLVGESESRMRDAIRQIEAQKGCVLVIDEADKAFGNAHDSKGDSGVTQRVFGTLLTWLQKSKNTFTIMTLNRTNGLPPEFLRAGRFDELFYTDLPTDAERQQIMEIHFRKRLTDASGALTSIASLGFGPDEWSEINKKTAGFVGSELEKVVVDSRFKAFASRAANIPTFEEVLAATNFVPLSTRDAEGVKSIQNFCKDKGTPVSRKVITTTRARTRNVDI